MNGISALRSRGQGASWLPLHPGGQPSLEPNYAGTLIELSLQVYEKEIRVTHDVACFLQPNVTKIIC